MDVVIEDVFATVSPLTDSNEWEGTDLNKQKIYELKELALNTFANTFYEELMVSW